MVWFESDVLYGLVVRCGMVCKWGVVWLRQGGLIWLASGVWYGLVAVWCVVCIGSGVWYGWVVG